MRGRLRKKIKMFPKSRLAYAGVVLLAMLLSFVFVSDDSEATTLTVDKFGGSDYTNITQAVDNASASDTIKVAARTYHDVVDIDKRLTILGGNYGVDLGDLYNLECDGSGDLVAHYRFDENGGSDVDDGNWCEDVSGDIAGATWTTAPAGGG